MTDPNFKFRFGKHAGKTYAWVEENDPSYIDWAKNNAPNLLKAPAAPKVPPKTKIVPLEEKLQGLQPNTNFYNEGPDPISLPYLKKMSEQKSDSNEIKSFFDLDI